MAAEDGDRDLPAIVRYVVEASFAAAPSVVDLFFGPVAGIAAAAGSPVARNIAEALGARLASRVEDVREGAVAGGIDLDELAKAVEESEIVMDLWRRAVRAGIESPWERKRRALGRALAEGALGVLGFDKELHLRIVGGIEGVEQYDVRLLDYIDRLQERSVTNERGEELNLPAKAARIEDLEQEIAWRPALDIVVENLKTRGLIADVGWGYPGGVSSWVPTVLGLEVLRVIREAAVDQLRFDDV